MTQPDDNLNEWNAGGTAELLRFFQEKSDDIAKVVIPQHPFITVFDPKGASPSNQVQAALVIHWSGGGFTIIPNRQDGEAVLNDGILNRMRIRIELGG